MANYDPLSFSTLVTTAGVAAASAKIYYYETGSTTPKTVYSNAGLTSSITQPVRADATGVMPVVYLSAGRYKRVVTTSADVTLSAYAADPIDASLELIAASAAPSTTYPFMRYHNTSDGHIYRRSSDNASWIDEGPVDSLGNTATVTQQLAGTSASVFSTPDSVASLWERGADITAAGSMSLPATGGNEFNISGSTTIAGISTATGGRKVRFKFASALTITYNATSMITPGAVDLTVPAGSMVEFTNEAAQGATGSNWRVSDIHFGNGAPLSVPGSLSKSADYSVTDSDRGGSIRYASMGADRTLTLPAPTGRAGFRLFLTNEDTTETTPWGVIVTPASGNLDGFTSRKAYTGSRLCFECDGTNWRTLLGNWRYFSGNQTFTSAGSLTLNHSGGVATVIPKNVWIRLKCLSGEFNYTTGDIVPYSFPGTNQTSSGPGMSVVPDTTALNVRFTSTSGLVANNKTSGASVNLTAASWAIQFFAED